MPNYDQYFEQWKSEANLLRQRGSTPQEICGLLAIQTFNDKYYYNTLKNWYQRTFTDWPSKGHKAQFQEYRPPQNLEPYPQAGPYPSMSPGISPAFPPQQRKSYPGNQPSYGTQQTLPVHSTHRPFSSPNQAMGNGLPRYGTDQYYSFIQNNDPIPSHHYPPLTSATSGSIYQLGDPPDFPHGLNQHLASGQYVSAQQQGLRYESVSEASRVSPGTPHPQGHPQYQHNGYTQQAATKGNEGDNSIGHTALPESNESWGRGMGQMNSASEEEAMDIHQFFRLDSIRPDSFKSMTPFGAGQNPAADGPQLSLPSNVTPKQPFRALDDQRYHLSQAPNHQSASQAAALSFSGSINNDQIHDLDSRQQPSSTATERPEPTRASSKHYRHSSTFVDATPPPQFPLPADPPQFYPVIHKGHGQNQAWRPVRMEGDSIVQVDPNRLPTDHPPKRVKGVGTKSHDSMVIHPEHLKAPHPVESGSSASYAKQTAAARVPLSLRPANSSNASVHSSLRDSGYISLLGSDVESRLSTCLSTLKLTDANVNVTTDCNEANDGYVEVEIKTTGRMRLSYIEKKYSSSLSLDFVSDENE